MSLAPSGTTSREKSERESGALLERSKEKLTLLQRQDADDGQGCEQPRQAGSGAGGVDAAEQRGRSNVSESYKQDSFKRLAEKVV